MRRKQSRSLIVAGLAGLWIPIVPVGVLTQDKPVVPMPKPGVPEITTLEGKFVRADEEKFVDKNYGDIRKTGPGRVQEEVHVKRGPPSQTVERSDSC